MKIQINLYIDDDTRDMFDGLVEHEKMNRPIYFTQLIKREYKKIYGRTFVIKNEPATVDHQEQPQ